MVLLAMTQGQAQIDWQGKFEQLGTDLATPNEYRTGSGAPGEKYWQQRADYTISVKLDDSEQRVQGSETITYTNNSPDNLRYLWVQLDQNVRAKGNLNDVTSTQVAEPTVSTKDMATTFSSFDYVGGFAIGSVTDKAGNKLPHTINRTMMRVDLPKTLATGESYTFAITWSYNINDRMKFDGRSGYEYFPEDDNYIYTLAQWYPRMAVYDDINGWQNKQFIGNGEFALTFGDFKVDITVPADHVVAATGELQNPEKALNSKSLERFTRAKTTFDAPVFIVSKEEAEASEKNKSKEERTWVFHAENVRDFAFASSRKFVWDAQAVKTGSKTPLAMSFYPKEAMPLWDKESTKAIKNTLEVYSERTFDYPYPVAISVHTASIGMEYPMICFNWGRPNANGSYSQQKLESTVGVIVHEIGHNFFPMIVNSDERQWTWMDEGLNSFLERETKRERYPDFSLEWGSPKGIVPYMKLDKKYITPIMTNSEQVKQLGYNAYGKPSAALTLLRETVMGPELFDAAFKEYAQRWAFKHPKPADFFRSMEDASAVDLDWFWRGWFYTTDHVDVDVSDVKWYRMEKGQAIDEGQTVSANTSQELSLSPNTFSMSETGSTEYGEFRNSIEDEALRKRLSDKHYYEIKFTNKGGLVTPLLVNFIFKDGTQATEHIPAEIWRKNENQVTKVFVVDREVKSVQLDPKQKTADTNVRNNVFPRENLVSKFDKFKAKGGKAPRKLAGTWNLLLQTEDRDPTMGYLKLKGKKNKYKGIFYSAATGNTYDFDQVKFVDNDLKIKFEILLENNEKIGVEMDAFVVENEFRGKIAFGNLAEYLVEGKRE